jgi:hypothetical protein
MAEKGVISRAAVAGIKPAAELVDRKRDNNSHVDVALRGLETGQLPAGQFDWMVHGGDARSGQKENP